MATPHLSLDDLATAWLPRRISCLAAMPGLNNALGAIQSEADITAFKHPVFPPFSAGNETTGILIFNGRNFAQVVPEVEIRWRAHLIERRAAADGWRFESRMCVAPHQAGVLVQTTITNLGTETRTMQAELILSGRSASSGIEGYSWMVPSVPADVFGFLKTEGLRQNVSAGPVPDCICSTNEAGNGHAIQAIWPPPRQWRRERIPGWSEDLASGQSFTICLLCAFHENRSEAESIVSEWHRREEELFDAARRRWEELWEAAFTPGNPIFSGHLPVLISPHDALNRLYYNGVLTILTCRREYPHALTKPCYLTLWPRRGEGSAYLAWELAYTSGILARLDPAALRKLWKLLASAPWLDYQMTNYFTGEHGGWICSAHPQSLYTAAFHLLRWSGDSAFLEESISRQAGASKGLECADPSKRPSAPSGRRQVLTGRQALEQALHVHREKHLPGQATIDFGGRQAYLECITTYAHGTAGHTALQAWALREAADAGLEPPGVLAEAEQLERAALGLFDPGSGHFDCEYPDGLRIPAANLYDLGLVLKSLGSRIPAAVSGALTEFARHQLLTPTWAHCLSPTDPDVVSGLRCDHQWAGCFSGWIPQFVLGALRSGADTSWMPEWLEGVARVTLQGPFAQAYWAEDMHPPEAGAAAKCFDELTQGNHWVIGSGVHFAEMVLDGICGLSAGFDGTLELTTGLAEWAAGCTLRNICHQGKLYDLVGGRLILSPPR